LDVVEVVCDHHIRRAVSQAVTECRVVLLYHLVFVCGPGQIKRGRYLYSLKQLINCCFLEKAIAPVWKGQIE
jgi:hypothetical protein